MKTYKIYFENEWDIVGWVSADGPIDALRKIYTYFNSIAGGAKRFCYTAELDSSKNVTL